MGVSCYKANMTFESVKAPSRVARDKGRSYDVLKETCKCRNTETSFSQFPCRLAVDSSAVECTQSIYTASEDLILSPQL